MTVEQPPPVAVGLQDASSEIMPAHEIESPRVGSPVDTAIMSASRSPSPPTIETNSIDKSPDELSESSDAANFAKGLERLDLLLERILNTEAAQTTSAPPETNHLLISNSAVAGTAPEPQWEQDGLMLGAPISLHLNHLQRIPLLPAPVKVSRAPVTKTSPQVEIAIHALAALVRTKDMHLILHGRVMAMLAMLRFYASPALEKSWTVASELAATGAGKGPALARQLRQWTTAYLEDSMHLPVLGCYNPHHALVEDKTFAQEVKLHLQGVGKFFMAMDIVRYTDMDEMRARVGLAKPISLSAACRMLKALDYWYGKEAKGMYVDGHERENVVEYRQGEFLRRWGEMEKHMVLMHKDSKITQAPPIPLRRIILFTHDESTFYANDQCNVRWIHSSESPKPIRKGDGTSLMVSDFCSPDYGWLRSSDGCVR